MKQEIRPFVMLNDIDDIYAFAKNDPSTEEFSVDTIRIGYPIINYLKESYHDFPTTDGKPATSTVALLLEINSLINRECNAGHNYAPHNKEAYCIEVIKIEDNIASVFVGS